MCSIYKKTMNREELHLRGSIRFHKLNPILTRLREKIDRIH